MLPSPPYGEDRYPSWVAGKGLPHCLANSDDTNASQSSPSVQRDNKMQSVDRWVVIGAKGPVTPARNFNG
jgi:hypothetical protein